MSSSRQPGHPSRRVNQSVSSTTSAVSASSSRSERSTRSGANPAVESAVTRLLVSIKQLLESLTKWSRQEVTENDISDVYVRLGNDFNAAVAAFAQFNIQMTELMGVPEELRGILETCLSEDATSENLELYLPEVRKIITSLLQGLRTKQSEYRQIVSDHKHRSSGTDRSDRDSRSSRADRASRREVDSVARSQQLSRGSLEPSDSLSRRVANNKRREPSISQGRPPTNGADYSDGHPSRSSTPVQPHAPEPNGIPVSRSRSASVLDAQPNGHHYPAGDREATPRHHSVPDPESTPVPASRPPSQVPSHVKRYSLVDRPVSSPTPPPMVVVDEVPAEPSPPSSTPEAQDSPARTPTSESPPHRPSDAAPTLETPGVQTSLAALRSRDALERRASKRFSTYNISKMTGGSLRERNGAGPNANRRSLAVSSALSPGELAVLTEADEEPAAAAAAGAGAPPVPPLPSRDPSPMGVAIVDVPPAPPEKGPDQAATSRAASPTEARPRSFPVFLQVGREVKKAVIEPGLSVSSLRVLFVDKFAYNPGQENFPGIYIRDPSSGVQYELEDMDEVKPKCLLSLNIEPLDQIKQHIDLQISSLSQDIKDLRSAVATNRRTSLQPPPPMIIAQPLAESSPVTARPTDRQFRHVARRLSRLLPEDSTPFAEEEWVQPQMTGASIQPQMTGASVTSEYTTRVVTDLKTQFDEVQNLRRDLGIMRQLYTEFMKQTKESLGTLRTQTQTVKQLASVKVGGARAYIDDGKAKLDSRSSNVLTKMEELQDSVENIKDDVLKRNVSPKTLVLKAVKADMEAVAAELQSLKEHIQTVKPMWKKTWEEELQNIVEEQQFLQHQEEFLSDLLEDHKAVTEVYSHVEKVISLRGSTAARSGRKPGFKPPPMDEGHTGMSTVMLEIRGAAVDPERRLKAIAANEKLREKELASRSDEFQSELTGFVSGKKLKMTGGADEVERVRQRRNEQTLKAMFTGNGSTSGTASSPSSAPSSIPTSPSFA
ncbi:hypothetical protein IEO21_05860 [Rhodonia placenta]|uniref:Actin interacting protein 3 C-terminal domain-containing protein n=1 Tax=Rhodonia placenta TaxID=104341 RepID=A0A8H7U1P5_9APHY|nr:hypothetical protein IEO21_05860 [Postia placenta]